MNIQVQVCALIVIIMIAIFFFGNKRIGLFTEKVFMRALFGAIICLILDISSVVMIVKWKDLNGIPVHMTCKLYLASLIVMGFSGLDYVLTDLFKEEKYKKVTRIIMILTGIESLIVMALPISAYKDGRIIYSYGLATTFTYVFAFSFIIATIFLLCFGMNKIHKRRKIAMSIWMLMWIAAASIQFLYNDILIVGFAVAMGVLILFIMLENPESLHDRRYGCFNSHALLLFTSQVYSRGEHYSVVDIYFEDNDNEMLSVNNDVTFNRVVDYFDYKAGYSVYKNVENEFVLFTMEKGYDLKKTLDGLRNEYSEMITEGLKNDNKLPAMQIVICEDCMDVKKAADLFAIASGVRNTMVQKAGSEIEYISENDIKKYYSYNEMINEMRSALEEDRVEVFFQPIFSREKGRYTSCEALARIRKTDGQLIPPGEFIEIAEETGIIIPLGDRIFEKVCQFLNREKEIYEILDYVEINLSVTQLENKNLADKFIRLMKFYQIDSNKINFEITETAAIKTKSTLSENLNIFLENGLRFSLDDFGKGESNLMYVVEMPVSILKLDMDMTQAYFVEPKAKYVLKATVKMAHDIGIYVVAEGVEEKDQLEALLNENIDFIQGFYFSKPVSQGDFIQLIQNSAS